MAQFNSHFQRLNRPYIFPLIEKKLEELKDEIPEGSLLNFGIGDVAMPLSPHIANAIVSATQEMTRPDGIHGYGPSTGYTFLKEAIRAYEFSHVDISSDEIFISDGANSDTVHILDLFDESNTIAIMDPTYPAYLNAAILKGYHSIHTLPCQEEHHFCPQPPKERCSLIYLCTPNNPTGVAMTRSQLTRWVQYALEHEALLLIDAAYAAFIRSPDVPKTIFEIEGARDCAIEFHSFSKSAGFTGLRCSYTILPKSVMARAGKEIHSLHRFWTMRQNIKFNGTSYPIQRGAEAVYSLQGQQETKAQVAAYLQRAQELKMALEKQHLTCYGGKDSPYLFIKTPRGLSSWDFFEKLIKTFHLLSIPGSGFGEHGEGFVRFSCFATQDKIDQAIRRLAANALL
jgi:LL-diaminopimelate aminotransferase